MQALAGVELPDGWAWADSTTSVGNASSAPAAYKIVPSGAAMVASDNNNEQIVLVNGTLTVRRPSSKPGASESGLREEPAKADGADTSGYTEDSAKKYAEALADAQKVLSDPKATKAQVDAALQALKAALDPKPAPEPQPVAEDGGWSYVRDGERVTGWMQDADGRWYHFAADGIIDDGWLQDADGQWY